MTLRIKYNEIFKTWDVEYFCQQNESICYWAVCRDYYKGKDYASFKTKEEAETFKTWKENKGKNYNVSGSYIECKVPYDYYNVPGRYYGD